MDSYSDSALELFVCVLTSNSRTKRFFDHWRASATRERPMPILWWWGSTATRWRNPIRPDLPVMANPAGPSWASIRILVLGVA